jgi:putative transposase
VTDAHHIRLPRIGVVKTHEPTVKLADRLADGRARILSATLRIEAGRWLVSFTCEVCREAVPQPTGPAVGVDAGVSCLAVVSTGQKVPNPRALSRYARRMARQGRECSRRRRGSRRHARSAAALARTHARVAHLRRDAMHKLTTDLARNHASLVVERLAVANLLRRPAPREDPKRPGHYLNNGRRAKAGLNRGIHDASMAELRRQLTYKCQWYGSTLLVADTFFPSSKTCPRCGWRKPSLSLSERMFVCENPSCLLVIDRDVNSSLNLKALVASLGTGSGPGTCLVNGANARGEERLQPGNGRCSSMNREAGTGSSESGETGTAALQEAAARIGSDW